MWVKVARKDQVTIPIELRKKYGVIERTKTSIEGSTISETLVLHQRLDCILEKFKNSNDMLTQKGLSSTPILCTT